jgi:hypothetical protein
MGKRIRLSKTGLPDTSLVGTPPIGTLLIGTRLFGALLTGTGVSGQENRIRPSERIRLSKRIKLYDAIGLQKNDSRDGSEILGTGSGTFLMGAILICTGVLGAGGGGEKTIRLEVTVRLLN